MKENRFLNLILRRETVLVVFVFSAVVTSLTTDFGAQEENKILPLLSLIIFPALAWFTHKRALLATWCTVLLLIMTGSGFLYDAFLNLTKSDDPAFLFSFFRILIGVYLSWGALILHRERHAGD